jgi:hypothetical protein
MSRFEQRLHRLEDHRAYQELRRQAAAAAERAGISADVLWAECRRVLCTLPDADQRQYFQRLYGELTAAETVELDAIRHRWATLLRGVR